MAGNSPAAAATTSTLGSWIQSFTHSSAGSMMIQRPWSVPRRARTSRVQPPRLPPQSMTVGSVVARSSRSTLAAATLLALVPAGAAPLADEQVQIRRHELNALRRAHAKYRSPQGRRDLLRHRIQNALIAQLYHLTPGTNALVGGTTVHTKDALCIIGTIQPFFVRVLLSAPNICSLAAMVAGCAQPPPRRWEPRCRVLRASRHRDPPLRTGNRKLYRFQRLEGGIGRTSRALAIPLLPSLRILTDATR